MGHATGPLEQKQPRDYDYDYDYDYDCDSTTKTKTTTTTTTTATARQSVMPVPFVCVTRATKVTINVTQWPHEDELPDHKGSRKNPRVPKMLLLGFSDKS